MRARDEPIHRYFAMKGYCSVRVDVRGSGDSDGVLHDEYSHQELRDALEILAWIASQPWCSGEIGMMGISWGGFNALQIAALQPPELKAIITLCSTDDRYADDAHYMGGCLLNENLQWGSILMMNCALPPDPDIAGDGWRDLWRGRLKGLEPFPAVWMRHPSRDEFWRHGSVCEDFAAIRCPVYAVGGWADGYSNAIPRLLSGLTCPRKGLVGPWAHCFPQDGVPGPAIGFLQEAVRWWDKWLKHRETGIMDEPMYRVWMQESVAPRPQYAEWPGRWVAEDQWPSARIQQQRLFLNPDRLDRDPEPAQVLSFSSPQTTGIRSGEWCGFGSEGEMPPDQRPDDGGSLCFDSAPLAESLEILGAPLVRLTIKVDCQIGLIACRLGDVAPDGSVLRVTYGLLNLTHHSGHDRPEALDSKEWYCVELKLNDIAHAFPAGHRLRVALSTSYWPIAWPAPMLVTLSVRTGVSSLQLPVRPPREADRELHAFGPPEAAPASTHTKLRHLPMRRGIEIDLTTNETVYTLQSDGGEFGGASLARIEDIDLDVGYTILKRYRIIETDPLSAQTELVQSATMEREGWSIRVNCRTRMNATATTFQFSADVEAYENGAPFETRAWTLAIPRVLL